MGRNDKVAVLFQIKFCATEAIQTLNLISILSGHINFSLNNLYMDFFFLQRHRITHHRGPVSGIVVAGACDVLISGGLDRTICVWDLDNFTLLNTMQMTSAVLRIDISWNSVS